MRHCNGKGFDWENLYSITDAGNCWEYLKLDYLTCLAYGAGFILAVAVFEVLKKLINWSLRPLYVPRKYRWAGIVTALAFFAAAAIHSDALREIVQLYRESRDFDRYMTLDPAVFAESGIRTFPYPASAISASPGRNLVLIILESTEDTYLREDLFPGLVPNLKQFSESSQHFTDIRMAVNSTISCTGIYCMFLGAYPTPLLLFRGMNRSRDTSLGCELGSLPKILNRAGYRQYACFGHDGSLAGTELFLRSQGYDKVVTGDDLNTKCRKNCEGWLPDSAVYEHGWKLFQEAAASGRPFNLTLLTLDAHGPDGYYSPDEPGYPRQTTPRNNLYDAMYASDAALGKFLRRIESHPAYADTVIVAVSDHLAHRFTNTTPLLDKNPHRRMLFCIRNPIVRRANTGVPGATFDIGPTTLAAMGVRHNYIFPLGENLYDPRPDGRRLVGSALQQRRLDFYFALKSRNSATLTGEVRLNSAPYPHLLINDLSIALVRPDSDVMDLPRGAEIFLLPVDGKNRVFSKNMEFFADPDHFCRNYPLPRRQKMKLLFCARNSPRLAELLRCDIHGEYVIGIIDHGVFRLGVGGPLPLRVFLE